MAEAGLNTSAEVLSPAAGGDVAEYFALMKPRVMFLVVFTALVGLVAAPGHMHPVLAVAALLCIAVGAGAAGALNMWYDADIDARMARTSARPIPRGKITADEARAFGTVLAIGSVICLGLMANWVAAALLALLRVRDYERAGVPMMPVVKGEDETRRQILIYSLILAPLGCVPALLGLGGGLYTVAAGFLGAFFVMFAYACYSERVGPDAERAAKNLFAYSVLYLFLLFAVLLVEQGFGLGRSSIPLFWTS
jgi:heme O synthase-like polyprenyltransferase